VSVTLTFLGGAGTVTGSKFLLDVPGTRMLVDCGLYQGLKALRLRNWEPLPVPARSIQHVVLTHAHIDHSGYLPRLYREGFTGQVHATRGTADLLPVMLEDSGRLQEEDAEYHNLRGTSKHHPALPLYTAREGRLAASRVTPHGFGERFEPAPGVSVSFARAGHILGAASVAVAFTSAGQPRRLVFSGDVGRYGAPIVQDPAPVGDADYIVVESTYGDRSHGGDAVPDQLARVVTHAATCEGAIIVPAFAVGRTQDLMYHLTLLSRARRIPRIPWYLDSPMAIAATEVYRAHPEEFDDRTETLVRQGHSPLAWGDFRIARTPAESRAINAVPGPVLIVAGSGMATGGRVLHHLRARLPDPRTTVLIVGYQALGTRGRALQEGAATLRIFGDDVPVRARVATLEGLSAHADREDLLRWLRTAARPPRAVCVVHGEPAPAAALAERVGQELGWRASVPAPGDRVVLD
jgi:metallo-beta-lactamase family protein